MFSVAGLPYAVKWRRPTQVYLFMATCNAKEENPQKTNTKKNWKNISEEDTRRRYSFRLCYAPGTTLSGNINNFWVLLVCECRDILKVTDIVAIFRATATKPRRRPSSVIHSSHSTTLVISCACFELGLSFRMSGNK